MGRPYITCPDCGSHLDHGEICTCKDSAIRSPAPEVASVKRRFEKCRECGQIWNVSRKKQMPLNGYLCPRCRSK